MVLREVVIPTAKAHNLPFAMMIGVKRQVNPLLGDAGDSVSRAELSSVEAICRDNPENRFMVTVLSRENQHELCVLARKFANLMPFGCWWFLNNPSIIAEITSERLEMLGTSMIPQHSDCRILEQLISNDALAARDRRRSLQSVHGTDSRRLSADCEAYSTRCSENVRAEFQNFGGTVTTCNREGGGAATNEPYNSSLVTKLVVENLKHRPLRTLLTVLAIGLQVTLVLTIVGLSRGLIEASQTRTRGVGADILIRPPVPRLLA